MIVVICYSLILFFLFMLGGVLIMLYLVGFFVDFEGYMGMFRGI